jgi:hypothetical protein
MTTPRTVEQMLLPRQPTESKIDYDIRKLDAKIIMNQKIIDVLTNLDKDSDTSTIKEIIDNTLEQRFKLMQFSPTIPSISTY